jgi:hypothetical protein
MRLVLAVVVKDGEVLSFASNEHTEPCKREGYPTGVGYDLCAGCNYPNHAEYKAVKGRNLDGATLYLFGHYYACEPCQEACKEAGVTVSLK